MTAYGKLLARLSRHAWFSNLAAVALAPLDRLIWNVSGGRASLLHVGSHSALPTLALTTTGRKSGKRRTTPVVYLEEGDRLFVMASNFGRGNHPAWSLNLMANPDAEVQLDGRRRPVRGRQATEEEKERMWPRQLEVWPPWTNYRQRTPRDFRGFFLEPAP